MGISVVPLLSMLQTVKKKHWVCIGMCVCVCVCVYGCMHVCVCVCVCLMWGSSVVGERAL